MADPFLSELRIFSFNFAPKGWANCSGQLLSINQNQALFSLLGTTYGGDGRVNFGLPYLVGRVPMHIGGSDGLTLGQTGGEASHTLITSEMPAHTHQALASSDAPNTSLAAGNYWPAKTGLSTYGSVGNENMSSSALSNSGLAQAHENRAPYLALNICIALQGIFPTQY